MRNLMLISLLLICFIPIGRTQTYTLVEDATANNGCYTLTPDNTCKKGAAWNPNKIDLSEPFDMSFSLYFGDNSASNQGADGMVFVLHDDPSSLNSLIGSYGSWMGYGYQSGGVATCGTGTNNEKISPSLGIEFDTYNHASGFGDGSFSGDHIAVNENDTSFKNPVDTASIGYDIADDSCHVARFIWDPSAQELEIYFDGVLMITYSNDIINNIFNGVTNVHYGFTAATASQHNKHAFSPLITSLSGTEYCLGDAVQLEVEGSGDFTWSPSTGLSCTNCPNPIANPSSPITYTVTANSNCDSCDISREVNFISCPCDFELDFLYEVTNCGVEFNSIIQSLPTGYDIVSTSWTFGDGYSSNIANPIHFYDQTGVYEVCLTVTIFNGYECCTITYCDEVNIEEECPGDCEIEADIKVENDSCNYTFTGTITSTSIPINTWYWDFGDGTTGNGYEIDHTFPNTGTYIVCLYLFESNPNNPDECCYEMVCDTIEVNCDSTNNVRQSQKSMNTDNPSFGYEESKKNIEVLKDIGQIQHINLFPNPNSGSFTMELNLKIDSEVTVSIKSMEGKQVYEKRHGHYKAGISKFNIHSNLSTGIYIVEAIAGNQVYSKTFVVE